MDHTKAAQTLTHIIPLCVATIGRIHTGPTTSDLAVVRSKSRVDEDGPETRTEIVTETNTTITVPIDIPAGVAARATGTMQTVFEGKCKSILPPVDTGCLPTGSIMEQMFHRVFSSVLDHDAIRREFGIPDECQMTIDTGAYIGDLGTVPLVVMSFLDPSIERTIFDEALEISIGLDPMGEMPPVIIKDTPAFQMQLRIHPDRCTPGVYPEESDLDGWKHHQTLFTRAIKDAVWGTSTKDALKAMAKTV